MQLQTHRSGSALHGVSGRLGPTLFVSSLSPHPLPHSSPPLIPASHQHQLSPSMHWWWHNRDLHPTGWFLNVPWPWPTTWTVSWTSSVNHGVVPSLSLPLGSSVGPGRQAALLFQAKNTPWILPWSPWVELAGDRSSLYDAIPHLIQVSPELRTYLLPKRSHYCALPANTHTHTHTHTHTAALKRRPQQYNIP